MKELTLSVNPSHKEQRNADACTDTAPYICPVTGLEMNGRYRYLLLFLCNPSLNDKLFVGFPTCVLVDVLFQREH